MTRFLFLTLGLMACAGDDSDSTTSGSPQDTAAPATPTGPVSTADTAEAMDTGDTDVAPTVTVTVNVPSNGNPNSEGLVISVADADGTFVRSALTDADGRVVFEDMPASASVTLVEPDRSYGGDTGVLSSSRQLRTVFGVEPGDELQFGWPPGPGRREQPGTIEVDLAANPNGTEYAYVYVECGGASIMKAPKRGQLFGYNPECQPGPVEVLAANYSAGDYANAQSFVHASAAVSGDPPTGSVDLTAWSTEHGAIRVVPPPEADEDYSTSVVGAFVGFDVRLASSDTNALLEAIVSPRFDRARVGSYWGSSRRFDIVSPVPGAGQTTELALTSNDFLPSLDQAAFDVELARPFVTLPKGLTAATCGSVTADALQGRITVTREIDVTSFVDATWQFIGAPSERYELPELDPTVVALWPTEGSALSRRMQLTLYASSDLDTAGFRQGSNATEALLDESSVLAGPSCVSLHMQ